MSKSSGWIIVLVGVVGAAAGWYWGSSEVAAITAALRARGETGDQYPILAPFFTALGLFLGLLVGLAIVGIRRLLRRSPAPKHAHEAGGG